MKKHILIHSIAFFPDGVSTAYLYNDLAYGFKKNGYKVSIITSTPHYNFSGKFQAKKKFFGIYFESNYKGMKVYHVPLRKHKSIIIRLILFLKWHFISLVLSLFLKNINYIISPSPPLTIGLISILIGKIKKAKVIYNVQEIYPDLLINQGGLKSKILILALKKLEKFVYDYSNVVVTIHDQFYKQIYDRFLLPSKLKIIPNFVDEKIFNPKNKTSKLPDVFLKYKNYIKVIYAGNIGYFQDWEPVFYTANKVKKLNIIFFIIGEGVEKDKIKEKIKKENISNIKLFSYQKREKMPSIINMGDIHFITIKKKLEKQGFPSKVYTIMACKKPLIVISGIKTPIYDFLENKKCSILITNNRNYNFYQGILNLYNNKNLRLKLGKNGYSFISKNYTKKIIINKYLDLLEKI